MTRKQITRATDLPGSFPITQRKNIDATKATVSEAASSLRLNSRISKIKAYFHSEKQVVPVKQKQQKISKWSALWSRDKKREEMIQHTTSNTVAVGTLFSLSVPITISNTTTHYHSAKSQVASSTAKQSIVQRLVILPPGQIYGLMTIAVLFLLVVAFAILQIHRSISIIEAAVDGIKYVLIGVASNSLSMLAYFKSWF